MRKIDLRRKNSVLIVAGPTASGKSKFALELASKLNGVVINSDSMQVYKELRIITARPTAHDELRLPHKLYGIISVKKNCSVGIWADMAVAEIRTCWENGCLPIVTGGTGFYIKALTDGLSQIPDIPKLFRNKAIEIRNKIGKNAFHEQLKKIDPGSAERISPSDSQRSIRAYEVFLATQRSLTDWHSILPAEPKLDAFYQTIIFDPPRDKLYDNCEARLDGMVQNNVLDEIGGLNKLKLEPSSPAMSALGVPEFLAYLQNEIGFDDALASAKKSTRRYAKRQKTWFRNQIVPDLVLNTQFSESLTQKIFSKILI